nr:hypothetical protein [Anaerolineae bacterium]
MKLEGKGFYIWKIHMCEGGNVAQIVKRARDANLSHVLIKIADGARAYNVDLATPLVEALKGAGIQAWGWQFVYGNEPFGEADIAIHRINTLGLDGFIVNAEVAYKNKHAQASAYMERLRLNVPDLHIGLSSFRYPQYHRELPWTEFLSRCDTNFPQVYWMQAHNPAQQTDQSIAQFQNIFPVRPIVPTGAAFAEWGWRPTPAEVRAFLSHAKTIGMSAANFWSWDYAGSMEGADLWDAVADFDWPVQNPPRDIAEILFDAMSGGLLDPISALYQPNAILVTSRHTYQGLAGIRAHYTNLFQQVRGAKYKMEIRVLQDNLRQISWDALEAVNGKAVQNAQDTIGLRQGLIQYHSRVYDVT